MRELVVVGSLNMDLSMTVPRMPVLGETMKGDCFKQVPGGKGANQAVAASLSGIKTHMVGRVGGDEFGAALIKSLKDAGVHTDYVLTGQEDSTGVAMIFVQGGDNLIVINEGSNGRVTAADIKQADELLRRADVIMLQFEIPLETVRYVIETYGDQVKIFLNPAPMQEFDLAILEKVTYLTPNETEAKYLTGIDVYDEASAFQALDVLRQKGVGCPIITMGEKGAAYFDGSENRLMPAHKVKAVDSTAAGDTFSGAFACMICEGKPMEDAIKFAQMAAAIATTRPGAQSSIPARKEVEKALES